mgnify:CR=1 FL=1
MMVISPETRLLTKDPYRYELQDVAEPNLYRDMFPYDEVPKISFNFRQCPVNMPDEIWMTDTTFRDGQQSREPYTVRQMVDLYKMMHRLGGPKGLIRQTEFFVYSEKDRKALEECMALGYEFPEITTWIRASKKDFHLVRDIGIKETGILASCSDYHIFKKLGKTRKEAMEMYLSLIADAFDEGIIPRVHLEDVTRADFYGFVVPFVNAIMAMGRDAGVPVKIRACDTMGYGVPFSGTSLPRSIPGIIYGLQHYSEVPSAQLEWHGHNDFYKSVTNATTAWLYGASAVNCTLLGIGERTGNVPLEAMVFEYAQLRGTLDGMDPGVITEIAQYYRREMHYRIPEMTPYVGGSFNVTRAGIHADGLMKDEEIYNIFDTEKILGVPPQVAISNTSGTAGIAHWINSFYGLAGDARVTKQSGVVQAIKDWVDQEYEAGRQIMVSNDEMEALVRQYAPELAD